MPKRQNPFGDNSPLQFKSHITPKEVDLGVDKDRKMLLVYEKTRNLLFSGAKKSSDIPNSHSCEEQASHHQVSPIPGQLCINANGGLCNNERLPIATLAKGDKMELDEQSSCDNNNSIVLLPPGQMQIDKTGHLCKASTPGGRPSASLLCHGCRVYVGTYFRRCTKCDLVCCVDCLTFNCSQCQADLCKTCHVSASVSDASVEVDGKCLLCR